MTRVFGRRGGHEFPLGDLVFGRQVEVGEEVRGGARSGGGAHPRAQQCPLDRTDQALPPTVYIGEW